jgi:ATP citrate (pro-S)-lyase
MVLMLTADHGPAVSGCVFFISCHKWELIYVLSRALNTIIASRAGKDLISSLCSGLLTIGSRFGAALDESATMFSNARDTGLTPREFVDQCRKQNKLSVFNVFIFIHLWLKLKRPLAVSGIGHKIKSVNNPDHRVELVKEYVTKNFPSHNLLDYALGVEKVTTAKKDTVKLLSQ